jgi:glycosyltransferase involved in cell wall biosynthesis
MLFPEFKDVGLPEILCLIAGLGFVLIVINYFVSYLPLARYKHKNGASQNEPVSVIVCAKNEDDNLAEFLPKILTQNYPNFEVIVVNDCSYDNTENVIDEFAKIFPNLKKVNIKEDAYYKHGKKFAILVGIKGAANDKLVFTDADCFPANDRWLQHMASQFSVDKKIVLGYGAYQKQKGFLNALIRYDSFMIAVNYLSAAIRKKAYMGVGRNLAYTKELFFENKGFSNHYHINSGDDDLFVNQASTKTNTSVCIHKEAITYSKAKKTFKAWRIQKARHLTTAPHYSPTSRVRLGLSYFSQYFFYISLVTLSFSMNTILLLPMLLFLKMIIQLLLLNKCAKALSENDLLIKSVVYELLLLFIYPIFQISKLFYKPNKWTN